MIQDVRDHAGNKMGQTERMRKILTGMSIQRGTKRPSGKRKSKRSKKELDSRCNLIGMDSRGIAVAKEGGILSSGSRPEEIPIFGSKADARARPVVMRVRETKSTMRATGCFSLFHVCQKRKVPMAHQSSGHKTATIKSSVNLRIFQKFSTSKPALTCTQ